MEHLSLEIYNREGSETQFFNLPEDESISITETSELFDSGNTYSFSFKLNVQANAHIFGSAGEIRGSRLHDEFNKRRARLWADGLPLFLGCLVLADEVEVDEDGNVDFGFESGQKTFEDMIDGAKANQVPMFDDVQIGMALWRKREPRYEIDVKASVLFDDGQTVDVNLKQNTTLFGEYESVQEYPRMVFPKGTFIAEGGESVNVDVINTDYPYAENADGTPIHPFCNIALCYQKYGYERTRNDGSTYMDYDSDPEAQRGYEYMPANRVNSAPCFYVIYWLRSLMKHLGIHIDENQMMGIEDMRRLFFVNTNCAYEEPKHLRYDEISTKYGRYTHDCKPLNLIPARAPRVINISECIYREVRTEVPDPYWDPDFTLRDPLPTIKGVTYLVTGYREKEDQEEELYHKAFASRECFPNADIGDVIKSLESGFGIRLIFSNEYRRVRIVLLRNIFRSTDVQDIKCDILSETKVDNCVRGFRMTYGESEDTHFYYKGFADLLPHKKQLWKDDTDKHDYSHWSLNETYADLLDQVSAFNKTCYVTPNTGNAYGIKVDENAKRYDDLHPALFGFADFMDAEDGDCTGEEETIHTVNVGFSPIIMNDLNMQEERDGKSEQRFALFVDEKMQPRRPDLEDGKDYNAPDVIYNTQTLYDKFGHMKSGAFVQPGKFLLLSDAWDYQSAYFNVSRELVAYHKNAGTNGGTYSIDVIWPNVLGEFQGHLNEGYLLYLQDNFEPNDTGVTPIETHDWGLTLGIMRGSGDGAHVEYSFDEDDGEGNDTWDIVPGSGAIAHADVCDCYGKEWDYGQDKGEHFSLKLRAEKLNPYFKPDQPEGTDNRRYLEISNQDLRGRGLCDKFYKEYSKFVREARVVNIRAVMTLAQLLAIDKTVRVRVGNIIGFVKKLQYSISNKTGLGPVTLEIMYI